MKKRNNRIKSVILCTVFVLGVMGGIYLAVGDFGTVKEKVEIVRSKIRAEYVAGVSKKAEESIEAYLSSDRVRDAVGTRAEDYELVRDSIEYSYEGSGRVRANVTYHIPGNSEQALLYHCNGEKGIEITYEFMLEASGKLKKADYSGEGNRSFEYRSVEYEGAVTISSKEIDKVAELVKKEREGEKKQKEDKLFFNKAGRKNLRCDQSLNKEGRTASFRFFEKEAPGRELLAFEIEGGDETHIWQDGHDYNFDGFYDLCLKTENSSHYFLWNQSAGKYEKSESLEGLENLYLDYERKFVYWESTKEPWTIIRFVYEEDKLKPVRKMSCKKKKDIWVVDCYTDSADGLKLLSHEEIGVKGDYKIQNQALLSIYDFIYETRLEKKIGDLLAKNQTLALLYETSKEPGFILTGPDCLRLTLKLEEEKAKSLFQIPFSECFVDFYLEKDLSFQNDWRLFCQGLPKEGAAEALAAFKSRAEKKQKQLPEGDAEFVADMGKENKEFRFYFSDLGQRSDRTGMSYYRYWLDIYEPEKRTPFQSMLLETTVKVNAGFEDVNFDGYTDFYMDEYKNDSPNGDQIRRIYCLWNEETRQFDIDRAGLSDLGDLSFRPKEQMVYERFHNQEGQESLHGYRYEKDGLKLVWSMEAQEGKDETMLVRETQYGSGNSPVVTESAVPKTEWKAPGSGWFWKRRGKGGHLTKLQIP